MEMPVAVNVSTEQEISLDDGSLRDIIGTS